MENRNEFIKIAVTSSEKEKYKSYSQRVFGSDYHLSEFIRSAVREKIRRIENPELFQSDNKMSPVMIEKLNKNSELLNELRERTAQSDNLFNELKDTLRIIENYTNEPTGEERKKVLSLFEAFKSLSLREIIRKSQLSKKKAATIVTAFRKENIIKLQPSGDFVLDD